MFVPQVTVIDVGDTVTWTNYDSVPHTVTSTTDNFNVSSPMMQKGDTFSFTFTKAGVFTYYCEVHPFMVGTIYVGVSPPQSDIVIPSSSPGLSLSVAKAVGGVSLTASLDGVPANQTAGVPVSFFGRYTANSSTYWLKLNTISTGSNGSARLAIPSGGATAFQAYVPQVGNFQSEYSNEVDLGPPAPAAGGSGPGSAAGLGGYYVPAILIAAGVCAFLSPLLLRRSRGSGAG